MPGGLKGTVVKWNLIRLIGDLMKLQLTVPLKGKLLQFKRITSF